MNETNLELADSLENVKDEYQIEEEISYSDEDIMHGNNELLEDLAKEHQRDVEMHEELDKAKNTYDGKTEPSSKIKQYQSLEDYLVNLFDKKIESKRTTNPNTFEKIVYTLLAPFGYNYKTINKDKALKNVIKEEIKKLDEIVKEKEEIVKTAQDEKKKQKELYNEADSKASQVSDTYFSIDEKIAQHNNQITEYKESIKTAKIEKEKNSEQAETLDLLIKNSYNNIKKLTRLIEEKESFQEDYLDQFRDYKTDADIAKQNLNEAKIHYEIEKTELNESKKKLNSMNKILGIYGSDSSYNASKVMTTNEKVLEDAKSASNYYEMLMKKRIKNLPIGIEMPKNDYQISLDDKKRDIKADARAEIIKYRDRTLA